MQCGKKEIAALTLAVSGIPFAATAEKQEGPLTMSAEKDERAYPTRPISIVVGYPPGGGADSLARLLAKTMTKKLGSRVIVVNRPGAAGNIGAEAVARATADGYTLFLGARPNTIHKVMYASLAFDFNEDLVPVSLIATTPNVIVASRHSPIRNLEQMLEVAETNPGQLRCASPGIGSTGYLLCEIFQQETGVSIDHVPYKGSAQAYMDLLSGKVDVLFSTLSSAIPHIRQGTLQGLAIMSETTNGHPVELPTMAERGLPTLDLDSWAGLMAPTGTPPYAIQKLNATINELLADEDVLSDITQLGYVAPRQPNPPEALQTLAAQETERWTAVLKTRNIIPYH
ncbi:tripartite tricarboxylate transporter substrate binding protein [Bordetella sp. LUAb4]|uniref:Bug family tripartite tricarboxylate transporter substrate binding protein n=1 Tax=Bordetella sp. LUAb4 TaxID=2843195 RepID=UPI001E54354F|nr:tripartite tricarboxylate transporter substrate-binding protein [Bordetella sp. LUAb4]